MSSHYNGCTFKPLEPTNRQWISAYCGDRNIAACEHSYPFVNSYANNLDCTDIINNPVASLGKKYIKL